MKQTISRHKHTFSLPYWHKHPLVVPVVTFMILFFVSLGAFVVVNGETMGPSDTKVVQLYVDGERRIVPTRANTVGDVLQKAGIELREGDVVEPTADTPIISQDFDVNVYRAKPITVVDANGQKYTAKVPDSTPAAMARKAGATVYPEDKVVVADSGDTIQDGVLGAKFVIERAIPININLYGNNIPTRTHAKTVAQALQEKGIKAIAGDTVQPALDTALAPDTQIFITSVGKQLATVEEAIPQPEEKISDPNTAAGTRVVKDPGSPGRRVITYEIVLENGREVSRRPIQEVIASQPVKRVIAEGTKLVISNPSANVAIGQRLAAERGWSGNEFQCLYQLWQKESKWNHLANNRNSGAYGIPQSLPGSKMGSVAPDWQTNPETQIKWGLGYIARSYKTPCSAWAKSQSSGWY